VGNLLAAGLRDTIKRTIRPLRAASPYWPGANMFVDAMGVPAQNAQPEGELCPRCKQPVSFQDSRCPNCGERLSGMARSLTLWIGVGGVGAILFVVLLMWLVVYNEDVLKAPLPVDEQSASQQAPLLPETSKDAGKEPPKPEKAPPLNK